MKEESNKPPIDPELEARIVALVLGEASEFETEELERLIHERPELAAFQREIQSVDGLLADVGAGESIAKDDDWKLSKENRDEVLAAISADASARPMLQIVSETADQRRSRYKVLFTNVAKIAAVLCVAGFIGRMTIPSPRASVSGNSSLKQIDLAVHNYAPPTTTAEDEHWSVKADWDTEAPIVVLSDGGATRIHEEDERSQSVFLPNDNAESDSKKKSYKSSLSDIRSRLALGTTFSSPSEMSDETPSSPAEPEFDFAQEAAAEGAGVAVENHTRAPRKEITNSGSSRHTADGIDGEPAAMDGGDDDFSVLNGISGGPPDRGAGGSGGGGAAENAKRPIPNSPGETTVQLPQLSFEYREFGQGQSSGPEVIADRTAKKERILRFDSTVADEPIAAYVTPPGEGDEQYSIDVSPGDSPLSGQMFGGGAKGSGQTGSGVAGLWVDGTAPIDSAEGFAKYFDAVDSNKIARPYANSSGDDRNKKDGEVVPGQPGFKTSKALADPANQPVPVERESRDTVGTRLDLTDSLSINRLDVNGAEIAANEEVRIPEDSNGRVKGTADGQPLGESQVGQKTQHGGWRYERSIAEAVPQPPKAKVAQSEIEKLGNGLPRAYRNSFQEYFQGLPAKRGAIRGETPQQSGLIAGNAGLGMRWYSSRDFGLEAGEYESKTRPSVVKGKHITRGFYKATQFFDESKKASTPAGMSEKSAAEEAFSTFSLHVSDVSFKLARAALASGSWPEASKIRIEEFVNAFDYGDPMPCGDEKVACRVEQSAHPFLQQRNVLRVSMRTAAAGRATNTPLRLTFLLDNSGSMERLDRQQTVRRAFALLASQLKPIDQVTLISFARQPRLLADKVSGASAQQLVGMIDNLPSEGGTNIEAALQLAFEKAREQQVDGAQNRIILLTDGAVNLGDAKPDSLSRMITTMRGAGIAFDAAGISAEGLNDEILEALTRKGDGRYYLLDSLEAADDGFARQIAGALRPSAKNVKVQIEFNPARVGRYKLLGYEKHRLKKEDFRNDKVDAAEMAAAEAGVAVYQFEAKPDGEGDVGSVSVRFRDLSTGHMVENRWPIPYESGAPRLDQAAPSLRIATCASMLAAKLRGDALGATVDLKTLSLLMAELPEQNRNDSRVAQLQQMIEQARQVSGK